MSVICFIALSILAFGLISRRIEGTVLTPPIVFVVLGMIAGPWLLNLVPSISPDSSAIHLLAEITLVLVLFTDAARIDLRLLYREHNIPVRLLGVGLPLTILAGTAVAAVTLSDLSFVEAALLAAILAPTDAALGQTVVSNKRVPVRIRQALNVESGLNDGIAFPAVLILIVLAGGEDVESAGHWIRFTAVQLTVGPLAGIAVAWLGGKLVLWGQRTQWMNHSFQDLASIGLSLLAFSAAELLGGNGYIAAFCAGLTLGNTAREVCPCLYEFAEAEGQLLTMLVFLIFGAVLLPAGLAVIEPAYVLYAVLSLTAIRMIPVKLSLLREPGGSLQGSSVLFLGWFGPRGIASVLYVLLLLETSTVVHAEAILSVVTVTVGLSVLLHGVTAAPAAVWYASHIDEMPEHQPERKVVTPMPLRLGESQHVADHTSGDGR